MTEHERGPIAEIRTDYKIKICRTAQGVLWNGEVQVWEWWSDTGTMTFIDAQGFRSPFTAGQGLRDEEGLNPDDTLHAFTARMVGQSNSAAHYVVLDRLPEWYSVNGLERIYTEREIQALEKELRESSDERLATMRMSDDMRGKIRTQRVSREARLLGLRQRLMMLHR